MIQLEVKDNKIILHNTDNVQFDKEGKIKVPQTITQEFTEPAAKLLYKNMISQIEQYEQMIKNSKTQIEAEQVKVDLNEKGLKHVKKVKKLLEQKAKELNFDILDKQEVVVDESQ